MQMKPNTKILLICCIALFVVASAITLMGALAKLQHWPIAGSLLTSGLVVQAASLLFGGFAVIRYLRDK